MEPSPAALAPGAASDATKDSGSLVWVEQGQGASRAPEMSSLLSSELAGGSEGHTRFVCRSSDVSSCLASAVGPLGRERRSPERGLSVCL